MSVADRLAEQARLRPAAAALVDGRGRRLTFSRLEEDVARAAGWLRAAGVRPGHTALVFVPVSVDLYVALLALFRLGATAMLVDPSAGRAHLEACCGRRPPDALLAVRRAHWLRLVAPALRRIPLKVSLGGAVPGARTWPRECASSPAPAVAVPDEAAALITFTSGSTGRPKAAVRTHGFLLAQHRALERNLALAPGDVDLVTLPVFTLANLASGLTTVIPEADLRRPGAVDAASIFAQVERERVTRLAASPAFFERLVEFGRATGRKLPGLRQLHTGGAPVFPRVLAGMRDLAPGATVGAVYGSTEAEPIAHVRWEDVSAEDLAAMRGGRGLLAGRPVPEVRLRILRDCWGAPRPATDAAGLEAETRPAGVPGEIVVAGDHVLRGYLDGVGDEETKIRVDAEVWHRTGDAGMLDEQGRLWLLGRCAARIVDDRGELYPLTVECVAMTFGEVRRAAALAVGGRRLLAIEAREGSKDLLAKLQAAVAWARIDEVRIVEKLPLDRRHNAKVDYPALRRMLGD